MSWLPPKGRHVALSDARSEGFTSLSEWCAWEARQDRADARRADVVGLWLGAFALAGLVLTIAAIFAGHEVG